MPNVFNKINRQGLRISAIVLAVFTVLLWQAVFPSDASGPAAAKAIVSTPIIILDSGTDMEAKILELGLGNDASAPRPAQREAIPVAAPETQAIVPAEAVAIDLAGPVRIKIPRIGVNTSIERVGLAPDGSMDVPKQPRNTAWYALGPRPGEAGSAIIAGHVDWAGSAAVFANLPTLKPGDTITVQDGTGAVSVFVVRESRLYDAAADATEVFVSQDGKAHLNLITCGGVWDKTTKQYSKRFIVFTDLATE